MGGKPPKGIITDQCPSMPIAIQQCMPTTIHRWCIWHIMKKVPQKLNGFKGHVDIEQEMSQTVSSRKSSLFEVMYDTTTLEINCKCLLFESRAIVCRHSLMVLGYERVDMISPIYILERWSKNGIVNRRHKSIKSSYDAPGLEQRTKRYNGMISRSYISAEEASEFEVLTAKYHLALDKLDAEMKEFKAKLKENPTIIHEDGSLSEINDLQSPPHVRSRGRPKKRLGSNTDKK
ncbi:hypothetical protein PIB30_081732 [Stylosanthes scabra]|uniref:SWIM-type domain-containing protein n=1 Tax=Stylosanthes scabra TaxID=79078 RepID=A0ABU6SSH1_9FABA|nr:hypothetical protein [Stylosanthes scabra]